VSHGPLYFPNCKKKKKRERKETDNEHLYKINPKWWWNVKINNSSMKRNSVKRNELWPPCMSKYGCYGNARWREKHLAHEYFGEGLMNSHREFQHHRENFLFKIQKKKPLKRWHRSSPLPSPPSCCKLINHKRKQSGKQTIIIMYYFYLQCQKTVLAWIVMNLLLSQELPLSSPNFSYQTDSNGVDIIVFIVKWIPIDFCSQ